MLHAHTGSTLALLVVHTRLLYNHARLYDPALARFVSADSLIPGQSATSGAANPQHLNRYAYVSNNPVKNTDPTGHNEWDGQDRGGGGPPPVEAAEELPEYQPAEPSSAEPLEEPLQSPAAQAKGEEAGEGAGEVVPANETAALASWENEGGSVTSFRPKPNVNNLDKHALKSLQKPDRLWTKEQILEAYEQGSATTAVDKTSNFSSATRYIHPETGKSVIVNNDTGRVVHVGGAGYRYDP